MSEITQQIKNYSLELIQKQASETLDAAAEYLTQRADNAAHPNHRQLYIETMHHINFERKILLNTFMDTLGHAFDELISSSGDAWGQSAGGIDTSGLKAVTDLEERLALETMISKAQARTELPLQSITRSLNGLMGDDWVQKHKNPLDPEGLIVAWLKGVHNIDMPQKAHLAMYALFDTQLLQHLPQLYRNIGQYLESLPKRNQSNAQNPSSVTQSERSNTDSLFGDRLFGGETEQISDSQLYNEDPEPERRTSELVKILDRLQQDRSLDDGPLYGGNYLLDFRALLVASNAVPEGDVNPWTIGQINDDVIDMTSLMFNFIMEDTHLPDDIRYHISRLQIPYLKLALQEKNIFSDKEHPARILLDNLAQSIELWVPAHTGGLDLLLNEIISVIDEIIYSYAMDSKIFSQIQKTFYQFLVGDEQEEELETYQREENSKADKTDNARLYIESTLDSICEGKRIPPVVNQLLESFWAKVLFLEYLKSGHDSEEFQSHIETTRMLVDSVQTKNSPEARKEMAKQLPGLVRRLKNGLGTISIAAYETVELFRELQECHMLVLKEKPEQEFHEEFEVPDLDYEEFKKEQEFIVEWNRRELENALLEESIERSLNRTIVDPDAFDSNRNVIARKKKTKATDQPQQSTSRKQVAVDADIQEARDAYERALKEHQANKASQQASDEDDFMSQFFQNPEFEKQQAAETEKTSSIEDEFIQPPVDDMAVEEDVFEDLEAATDTSTDTVAEVTTDTQTASPEPEKKGFDEQASRLHSNDELQKRAHGALEDDFEELEDAQVSEIVERLKVGLWVDLHRADGSQTRAKIMAIVPTVGKYIFGDRAGKKLADFNKPGLVEALRTGAIRVTEVDNVYDKTLESVISNLRVMKKAEDD